MRGAEVDASAGGEAHGGNMHEERGGHGRLRACGGEIWEATVVVIRQRCQWFLRLDVRLSLTLLSPASRRTLPTDQTSPQRGKHHILHGYIENPTLKEGNLTSNCVDHLDDVGGKIRQRVNAARYKTANFSPRQMCPRKVLAI